MMREHFQRGDAEDAGLLEHTQAKPFWDLTSRVLQACIEVHRELGPGLLESIYQEALKLELKAANIQFDSEVSIPIRYKETRLQNTLRLDFLIENKLILELKSVEQLLPVHQAQLLSYLKLTHSPVGLLINFNVAQLKQGVHRIVNVSANSVSPR